MAVREVIRWGDPRLLQPARPVERFDTPELHALVRDLEDTMAALQGAGIAAPQIAVPLQVVIFGGAPSARYPEAPAVPYTVLVNPVLEPLGNHMEEGWEGCLSVPGMRGLVPRHHRLRYRGRDACGAPIERLAEGFHARLVQHECDHLAGILYPMRVRDLRHFGFTDVLFPGQAPADD
ncbi:MAG: peptide deformylase [Betaproteobacteria bacterium]|jgi:peptide deformylase|nr:peptide deformylase [Rhodocyclaceae bacterium]MCA3145154.1 peptide deformylase [Rhodocyclaceae bacterium]MCE2897293.1 peptide deformylase [Betaproteobacteria bacterium]